MAQNIQKAMNLLVAVADVVVDAVLVTLHYASTVDYVENVILLNYYGNRGIFSSATNDVLGMMFLMYYLIDVAPGVSTNRLNSWLAVVRMLTPLTWRLPRHSAPIILNLLMLQGHHLARI